MKSLKLSQKCQNTLSLVIAASLAAACGTAGKNNGDMPLEERMAVRNAVERFNSLQEAEGERHKVHLELPFFELTPSEMDVSVDSAISRANAALDRMAKLEAKDMTFANTIGNLDDIYYDFSLIRNRVHLIGSTHPKEAMRKRAKELEVKMSKWGVDTSFREDIYKVVRTYAEKKEKLNAVDKKLLDDTVIGFKRIGFHLPKEGQARAKKLRKELAELTTQVGKNILAANKDAMFLTEEEVKGIPAESLKRLPKEGSKYKLLPGVAYHRAVVLEHSANQELRKRVVAARYSRAKKENLPIIKKVINKRAELSQLLGYKNFADFSTELRMAKNGQTARDFLEKLAKNLDKKFASETKMLLDEKIAETKNPKAVINEWDVPYYITRVQKKKYNVDMEALRKFFRYEKVLRGMYDVFEEIFLIKVEPVKAPYVWSPEVELIRISDRKTKRPLGYLYLDMFPRAEQGKDSHFAMYHVRAGKMMPDGKYMTPIDSLVCNFPKATDGKPSLLSYGNVNTLFHEFGHALHHILTTSKYYQFSGTIVPRDFVEAPSQMLEKWVESKKVLDRFARDYQNPQTRIPQATLNRIKEVNLATKALFYRRQLAFGILDLRLHMDIGPKQDFKPDEFTNKIVSEIYFPFPEGAAMIANFGHLFGGYAAGYYGYAWSDVLASDMASVFEKSKKGFLDTRIGIRLRKEIYETGHTRDVNVSLKRFLGRKPNQNAFLKSIGLK